MGNRDLILGVMATQTGFATPAQVMEAASAVLLDATCESLLHHLERRGTLSVDRRVLLEAMADAAMARSRERGVLTQAETLAEGSHSGAAPVERSGADQTVPPEREGQYSRLRELGHGGQSAVVSALDNFLGREVAIKELLPTSDGDPTRSTSVAAARFLREVRLTAQLDHPGIVAVHELAQRSDGTLFCTQKLIRGQTLKARLARCRSLRDRLGLLPHLTDACQAIAYAHSRGVIHRDLKPSNIMVGEFGETVVVDWGLAKRWGEPEAECRTPTPDHAVERGITVTGVALGTPAYMSPEQARGALEQIDVRSDIFSLGAILYELLCGRVPFKGASNAQTIEKVLLERAAPVRTICPEVPADLAAIVERALQHEPSDRYQRADELAGDLLSYRAGDRVRAYEYRPWELLAKFARRHRGLTVASLVALMVLAAFGANTWRQLHRSRLDLAGSLLERARDAEKESDWGRAAGYYAASRVHHDSREARWGAALARQRMLPRLLARRGPEQSVLDVGYLRNGVALAVGAEGAFVVGRELDSGRELWRFELSEPLREVNINPGGQVQLTLGDRRIDLDAANGGLLQTLRHGEGVSCRSGPSPAPVVIRAEGLVATSGREPFVISPGLDPRSLCAVSDDGRLVAFLEANGIVHLWDLLDGRELARRDAPDTSKLLFTAHGVAILRARAVQVFGGNEGDFFVAIPGRGGNGLMSVSGRGTAVSPDGHLLVTSRLTSNQADLVDLRTRTVVASFSFPPGVPSFAFSPASDRLVVAGLLHGSVVAAWDLRARTPPSSVKGSPVMAIQSAKDGRRFEILHYSFNTSRYEVWEGGALLRSGTLGKRANATISSDGRRVAVTELGRMEIRDAGTGQTLWRIPCERCPRIRLSGDGGRLLTASLDGRIELWDLGTRALVWSERRQVDAMDRIDISDDGIRVLRSRGVELSVSSVDAKKDAVLRVDDTISDVKFSYDGSRIAVVTSGSIGVWETQNLRPLWRVPSSSPVDQEAYWSADDSALLILQDSLGTSLLDSATGERFATFRVTKPGAFSIQEVVLPSLRERISRGDGAWELWPIPPPEDGPPRASLARVLSEAGLEMHGAELVDAAPRAVAPR
jgi:serine/threonine protein kinase/WD40 repeat protein